MNEIDIEILRELLSYDPDSGVLTWKVRDRKWFKTDRNYRWWNTRFAGKDIACVDARGYILVCIFYKLYKVHRVAYAIYHDIWPSEQIDHINGIRTDNRIINLRNVSNQENLKNQAINIKNTSGTIGVSWSKQSNKWIAQIKVNGKQKHLGYFTNIENAISARKQAEIDCGFHPNHGRDPQQDK